MWRPGGRGKYDGVEKGKISTGEIERWQGKEKKNTEGENKEWDKGEIKREIMWKIKRERRGI